MLAQVFPFLFGGHIDEILGLLEAPTDHTSRFLFGLTIIRDLRWTVHLMTALDALRILATCALAHPEIIQLES